jgi:hypothetical protein
MTRTQFSGGGGGVDFTQGYSIFDARYVKKSGDTMTGQLFLDPTSDIIPLRIMASMSQTLNLLNIENASGTNLITVDYLGAGTFAPAFTATGTGLTLSPTMVPAGSSRILTGIISNPTWTATGFTGTSNRVRGFNSTVTVSTNNASDAHTDITGFLAQISPNVAGTTTRLAGLDLTITKTGSGATTSLYGATITASHTTGTLTTSYGIYLNMVSVIATTEYAIYSESGVTHLNTGDAGNRGLIIAGASSQSANLQEWQNSSASILAFVNKDGGFVFNETGADTDCRIEGDNNANLFYTDASADAIGIGTATPAEILHIYKGSGNYTTIRFDSGTTQGYFFAYDGDNSVHIGSNSNSSLNLKVNNSTKLTIDNNGDFTLTDGGDFILGSTTGTKIATATSQKVGFWNTTPIVQPTTAVTEATFVENAGGVVVNDDSTFDGYTLGQVVKALRNIGLLA